MSSHDVEISAVGEQVFQWIKIRLVFWSCNEKNFIFNLSHWYIDTTKEFYWRTGLTVSSICFYLNLSSCLHRQSNSLLFTLYPHKHNLDIKQNRPYVSVFCITTVCILCRHSVSVHRMHAKCRFLTYCERANSSDIPFKKCIYCEQCCAYSLVYLFITPSSFQILSKSHFFWRYP